jgi:hypothetical protein
MVNDVRRQRLTMVHSESQLGAMLALVMDRAQWNACRANGRPSAVSRTSPARTSLDFQGSVTTQYELERGFS